jgi:pimeloyl-ACP methyl ester carboxylesterase
MAAQSSEKTRVVRASGIDFHILEMGAGPLFLCLHGFPDTAHSFRHQMPMLADAGYHVVAPFMRGYAPTGPAPDGRYDIGALGEDALALIDALGASDAILFGHDWGATAAYDAAVAAPKKIRKLITAAVPHGPQVLQAIATNYAQQKRSWYMYFFQSAIAEMAVSLNDFAFLEKLWADWSPGWKWAPEDMEALKRCFRAPGTTAAALGYYRATLGPMFRPPAPGDAAPAAPSPIEVPALMLQGRIDGCIGAELTEGMAAYFPRGLRIEIVEGAGHFLHREKPAQINQLIVDFLKEPMN